MSISTSRPCRQRRQPTRNKDKVELNMELIEKLENSKAYKGTNGSNSSNAKLLVAFVNGINQSQYIFKVGSRQFQNSVRQKQAQSRKLPSENNKTIQSYSGGMTKKSKLNNGKVVQYPAQNIKNEDRKVQKMNNSNNFAGMHNHGSNGQGYRKQLPKYMPSIKDKIQKPDLNTKNEKTSVVKPFKRYSYHVAIAYKIHLEKIKSQNTGICDPNRYDPTYPARKLKQQQIIAQE